MIDPQNMTDTELVTAYRDATDAVRSRYWGEIYARAHSQDVSYNWIELIELRYRCELIHKMIAPYLTTIQEPTP